MRDLTSPLPLANISTYRRWLILAHPFNMDGRAASHTITDKIPHLLAAGIEVVVISGVTGKRDDRFEHHQVWSPGPSGFKFELRHVLRQKLRSRVAYRSLMLIASLLLLPLIFFERLFKPVESSWSWYYSAVRRGLRLAEGKPFDLIYSTAGPFAAHLAACTLQYKLGTPWLAEIHDPLVLPGSTPSTRRQKAYAEVERKICTDADIAIWFTDQALASALRRHPALDTRGRVILPGVDRPFYGSSPPYIPTQRMVLGHFGSLSRTRTFSPFIESIAFLKVNAPNTYQDLEVHIYGGPLDEASVQMAKSLGVWDRIRLFGRIENDPVTGLSGREKVLARMRQCDVLVLVHGDDAMCAEYIPSKLYEYLWMQRPILATVHNNPQMAQLIREQGHQVAECSLENGGRSTHASTALSDALIQLWERWKINGLPDIGKPTPYTTAASTQQLIAWVELIDQTNL
jgi:hypothetical protein